MGKHYLLNLYGCSFILLDNCHYLIQLLESAAVDSGATVVQTIYKKFDPQGVTALCLLSESHISIHTYPELGNCYVDIFTCGNCNPKVGVDVIIQKLNPNSYDLKYVDR